MGHFGGKPREGQRPGADVAKRDKERMRGRIKVKSPQQLSILERKRRLNDLQERIRMEYDPQKREPLYKKYANSAASCPPEVFTPDEITGVERHSSLSDTDVLRSFEKNYFQGSRPDFLPLHHLVKLLIKPVAGQPADRYVYLLGSTSATPDETSLRNMKGLEYFLLTFAQRMPRSHYLDLEVDKRRVQVQSHNESGFRDSDPVVVGLRSQLRNAGISPNDHYVLRGIQDGNHGVSTPLHVITEQRAYMADGRPESVMVSYATVKV
ncbi:hypothetical protein HY637_00395 [Candidatus Woesearchaeota archaeon]|nr:hypothetical protein [Candidatus Woesearchaeota archaeon]